jgi:hypothetical protein
LPVARPTPRLTLLELVHRAFKKTDVIHEGLHDGLDGAESSVMVPKLCADLPNEALKASLGYSLLG